MPFKFLNCLNSFYENFDKGQSLAHTHRFFINSGIKRLDRRQKKNSKFYSKKPRTPSSGYKKSFSYVIV